MSKKRGRPRKTGVSRFRNGEIRSDGGTEYGAMQREARFDPASASRTLPTLRIPETARTRQEQDTVHATVARTRDPLLGSLLGLAFKRNLFRWFNCRTCGETELFIDRKKCLGCQRRFDDEDKALSGAGGELLQAADIYAALHRQVWGKLPADIEAALLKDYGPDAFNLLLELGRVRGPAPPASHFRKLVGETPRPTGETDPAEYLKRRLRHADRFGAARAILYGRTGEYQRRGAVVENVVIWAIEPAFLRTGEVRTARIVDEQIAFVSGLRALAEHYQLFDRRERDDRPGGKGGETV